MLAAKRVILLVCIHGILASHLTQADTLSDTLQIIRDNFRGILSRFHYLPVVSNLDQCAPSRLKLDELFAQKQPYNIKSATCQIQDALSSNPIGCRKIKGDNSSAAGCGLDTAQLTQPAFTTDPIRNASLTLTKDFIVNPPDILLSPKRRQLLSTRVSAEPLASITTVQGSVAYYNPNNSTVDSQDFYDAFYKYWNQQQYTRFVVQTGNYSVINPVGGFHLQAACGGLNRALPFELDFGGSTFVFTNGTYGGVFFAYCYNLYVHNATFYYNFTQNPWYQATVTGISANSQVWNITVQDGYPTNYVTQYYQALCVPWNPVTRLPKQNTSDIYPTPGQTTSLGGSNFQFNFNYNNFGISVGDYITCRGNQGNHGIIPWYSQNMTVASLTFYNPAVFGIYEETGYNNTYINNRIIPYPSPVGSGGAQQAPLQSSTADGFHASTSIMGPTLINNTLLNSGDDGIAIHGRYYLVVAVDKAGSNITVATGCAYPCDRVYQGLGLTGYTNTTQYLGMTTILASNAVPNPLPAGTTSVTKPGLNLATGTSYLNITVACWPTNFSALAFDSLVTSRDDEGDGFSLINNTVGYNRGRGLLLKAGNGIVTGNQFIKPKFIAAQITPEIYWLESDFVRNVIVTNNIFDSYYGGITLGIILDGSFQPGQFQNHYNVTISGNIIRSAADQPLLITSATAVNVTNNLFDSVLCYPYQYGAAQTFVPTPQPPIFIAYASNLHIVNNTYNVPANCTYGNFSSPIQTYGSTVTGLVTS